MSNSLSSPLTTADILRTAIRESAPSATSSEDLLLSLLADYSLDESLIPALTSASKENTLVSFRCMIQDTTCDPEIFLPHREGDTELQQDQDGEGDIDYSKLRERGVVFAVGVPGESSWVGEILNPSSSSAASHSEEPHKSVAHKFPYLKAKTESFAGNAERVGAFIKTYDSTTPSPPTSLQTYIGLLTFSSPPTAFESDAPAGQEDAQIPSIHVLKTIEHPGSLVSVEKLPQLREVELVETRKELVQLIAQVGLGGEEDWVAEWVLVALCGKNLPPLTPLTLSLLLPTPPTPTTSSFSPLPLLQLLPYLLPLVHPLPLSLPLLNLSSLAPRSTPTEDLAAGALQLPKGGLLYVDETPLGEGGKLTERGLRNLEVGKKIVRDQSVEYEFEYSKFAFGVDLGVLVVGEGRGGLIEVDAKIHLHTPPAAYITPSELAAALPSADKLVKFRSLIARAREGTLVVPTEVSEQIQSHFVTHRSVHGPLSLTPDTLGLRMKLARGIALSQGQTELDLETWSRAWGLDEKRAERSAEGEVQKEVEKPLGKPTVLGSVGEEAEEEESDSDLEIEGGPIRGAAGMEKMVGR